MIKHEKYLTELFKTSLDFLNSRSFLETVESILKNCRQLIGATGDYFILLNSKGSENEISFPISDDKVCYFKPDVSEMIREIHKDVYKTGKAVYYNNFNDSKMVKLLLYRRIEIENLLVSPISIDGKVIGLIGFINKSGGFNDIDLRFVSLLIVNAEAALLKIREIEVLKKREELFYSIAVSAEDAIICADINGMIIFWNKSAEKIFGYSEENILGKSIRLLVPERFRLAYQKEISSYIVSDKSELFGNTLEIAGLKNDGVEFPVELSFATWKSDTIIYFAAIIRDITIRRQYDTETKKIGRDIEKRYIRRIESLRNTNEKLKEEIKKHVLEKHLSERKSKSLTILEQTSASVYMKDIEGRYIFANKRYREILNITEKQLIGKTDYDLFPQDVADNLAKNDRIVMEKGKPLDFEETVIVNNQEYCCLSTKAPLLDSEWILFGICGISMDITERKNAENRLKDQEQQYRELVEGIDAIVWEADPVTLKFTFVSPNAEQISGFTVSQWLNDPDFLVKSMLQDDCDKAISSFRTAIDKGKNREIDYRMIRSDGAVIWMRNAVAVVYKDGKTVSLKGLLFDITARRRSEEKMRELFSAVEQSTDWVLITDTKGNIEYVNKAVKDITGYSKEELAGRNIKIFKLGKHDEKIYTDAWNALISGKLLNGIISYRKKNGNLIEVYQNFIPIKDEKDNIIRFLSSAKDITEQKNVQKRMHHLTHYDLLTGLPNRSFFIDRVNQGIAKAEYKKRVIAVLIIDIDRFKFINDTYGFEVGDEILNKLGNILSDSIREGDTVARLGNDEFGVSFIDVEKTLDILNLADEILQKTAVPMKIADNEIIISVCIGISIYPEDGKDAEEMLKKANLALLRAKKAGTKTFKVYTQGVIVREEEVVVIERNLFRALKKEEYILHYQPYFEINTKKMMGIEALVRWNSRELGPVSPGKFIPLLEESGMIIEVGKWILKTVIKQLQEWKNRGYIMHPVCVNLSKVQFRQKDLVQMIHGAIQRYGIDPYFLVLEITENTLMYDIEYTKTVLNDLKSLGVSISIDDFGTGYASMNYLKRFPIDNLKFDTSFVREIALDPDAASIATAIITVAHNLNINTIAEGVETEEQWKILRLLRCNMAQGYYLSRPLPPTDFEKLLYK